MHYNFMLANLPCNGARHFPLAISGSIIYNFPFVDWLKLANQ